MTAKSVESIKNVFVYGTLMKGYGNHRFLEKEDGESGMLFGYRRIWPESRGFPVIVKNPKHTIKGEIYKDLSDDTISLLDRLEGVPNMYHKRIVTIKTDNGDIEAVVYYPSKSMYINWKNAEKAEGVF